MRFISITRENGKVIYLNFALISTVDEEFRTVTMACGLKLGMDKPTWDSFMRELKG